MKKRTDQLASALIVLSLVVFPASTAIAADLQVEDAVVCSNVVDRQPVDSAVSFSASVGRLYFYTRIVGAEEPTQVVHAWYYGDAERARVTLAVNGSNWRTYSSKVIQAHETGAWRVEVLDADGNSLETVQFDVTQ
ncbi:MAG: hypothetical protein AMJ54_01480 [Deltaproteobacteria bacterium SG8_13]|nr:MAG: hypothetical protein AMJ54_01480 [Deltaproteobacteria bacterium SG8_13]